MIYINELYKYNVSDEKQSIKRVLWLDHENEIVFCIDINARTGFPEQEKVSEFISSINEGQLSKVESDPYLSIIQEDKIKQIDKKKRDRYWEILGPFINCEPDIYMPSFRGPLVRELSLKHKITRDMLNKAIRRYFQRGKNPNALLPDYYKSGGKGKEKTLGDKKLGRPKKFLSERGLNIDEDTKRIFRIVLTTYYLNQKELSLKDVFTIMLQEYFSEEVHFEGNEKKLILIPENQRPSFRQFQYFCDKEYSNQAKIKAQQGINEFNKNFRTLFGSTIDNLMGPGSRFEIDATTFVIYLVSRFNRNWVVGRPVLYVVSDTFSRMVCGFYAGFEGPSWLGAMMAILNTATNKVKFCREYGITITEDIWPCNHLPDVFLADRGSEWIGKPVETISKGLNIRIENAAGGRPEWKGVVERQHRTNQEYVKPFSPGYVLPDFKERGAVDYRLDAKLDIDQFTRMMIRTFIYHNHKIMKSYRKNEELICDDIKASPLNLWNWGIENRSRLRSFPEEVVKLNLLPMESVLINRNGIKFKQMYYMCENENINWLDAPKKKPIMVSYDPRNLNQIYLRHPDGRSYDICHLNENKGGYKDKTVEEINYMLEYEKWQNALEQSKQLEAAINLNMHLSDIRDESIREAEAVAGLNEECKSQKVKGIKSRRKIEKDSIRENEAFILGDIKQSSNNLKIVNFRRPENKSDEHSKQIAMLKQIQKEMQNENS